MAIATVEHAYEGNVKWAELSEGSRLFHTKNCMPAAEAIVKHLQSLKLVDVDDEILWQYPIEQEMYKFPPTCKCLGEEVVALQEAARYGALLAGRIKSVAFGEWINKGRFDFTGKYEWVNLDTKEIFTTDQLYEIFEVEYLKNKKQKEK